MKIYQQMKQLKTWQTQVYNLKKFIQIQKTNIQKINQKITKDKVKKKTKDKYTKDKHTEALKNTKDKFFKVHRIYLEYKSKNNKIQKRIITKEFVKTI